MAEISSPPPGGQASIPFWRDARVLGVLAQIAFVIAVVLAAGWILGNVGENLGRLGAFRCSDGTNNLRCGFNFLNVDAQFEISETAIAYDPSDTYRRALLVGAANTVKVAVFGIILATVLGTVTGIARLSSNWLVSNIAKWYVDIIRNTPLLLQLFFLYFGVILAFPAIAEAAQPLGLPVYFSQRGINLPSLVFMPSAATWVAFLVLGVVQAQVVWVLLGRQAEHTGRETNQLGWAIVAFLFMAVIGWFVAGANADNQGALVPTALRVREFDDLDTMMERRLGISNLGGLEGELMDGTVTQADLDEAALRVCAVRDDSSEANLTTQLARRNIPYTVSRFNRVDQVTEAFAAGECEFFVANRATLAGERNLLGEDAPASLLIPVPEAPVRVSMPRIEGLNFVGGAKLSPNFAAILIGLVLYTAAFIAEIVRAGIQSVAKGQSEAARALGLTEGQRLRLVVLPQAMRVIIPPLTSQYLNLTKNSSLAIAVGFPDLWSTAFTTLNQSGQSVQVFLIVMATYLSFSLFISFLLNWYNKRIALVER